MRFYGREEELVKLAETKERSLQSSTFTVIIGRRRIGKTTLMLKSAVNHRHVYLFVSRTAESILCSRLQESATEAGVDIIGNITEFRDLFKALMLDSRREPLTVIIDEFQELNNVNPGIFSSIQEIWDRYHEESHMNLLVGGSVHSMMVRLFEDEKQPLFDRATSKVVLRPFKTSLLKDILTEHVDKLHFVAQFLLKNEFMDEDQFKACMEMDAPTIEAIEAIATERKRVSEEENKSAHQKNARNEELERERARLMEEALRANALEGKPADNDFDLFTADGPINTDDSNNEENK